MVDLFWGIVLFLWTDFQPRQQDLGFHFDVLCKKDYLFLACSYNQQQSWHLTLYKFLFQNNVQHTPFYEGSFHHHKLTLLHNLWCHIDVLTISSWRRFSRCSYSWGLHCLFHTQTHQESEGYSIFESDLTECKCTIHQKPSLDQEGPSLSGLQLTDNLYKEKKI